MAELVGRKRHAKPTPEQLDQLDCTSSWPAQLAEHTSDAVRDLHLVAAHVEEALYVSVQSILPNLQELCQADLDDCSGGRNSSATARSSSSSSSVGGGSSGSRQRAGSSLSDALSGGPQVHPEAALHALLQYICSLSDSPVDGIQLRMEKLSLWQKLAERDNPDAQPPAAIAEAGAKAAADVAAAWSQHAIQLSRSLEGCAAAGSKAIGWHLGNQ